MVEESINRRRVSRVLQIPKGRELRKVLGSAVHATESKSANTFCGFKSEIVAWHTHLSRLETAIHDTKLCDARKWECEARRRDES